MNADDPNTSRADKPNDAGLSVHKSEHRKYSIPNKNAHKEYANILEEIKNSPKNTYFKYSKKFKPAKLNELGFQFDFSLFNSNCPYYPKALDDINTKINRDRSFWKAVLWRNTLMRSIDKDSSHNFNLALPLSGSLILDMYYSCWMQLIQLNLLKTVILKTKTIGREES